MAGLAASLSAPGQGWAKYWMSSRKSAAGQGKFGGSVHGWVPRVAASCTYLRGWRNIPQYAIDSTIRNMTQDESGSIQVIDRLTALLEVLARNRDAVSLKVLAADTELHPSTAFRILASATENGLVAREGNRYRLGIRLLQLGSRVASHRDLRREARPLMEALRDQIGETVNLTVRQGDEVVYLERALPERMMRVEQRIGSRAPLHVTAVGKLMLGEGGEAACRDYAQAYWPAGLHALQFHRRRTTGAACLRLRARRVRL